jgi:subtilisin family serine protease
VYEGSLEHCRSVARLPSSRAGWLTSRLLSAVALLISIPLAAEALVNPTAPNTPRPTYRPGEIIVRFRETVTRSPVGLLNSAESFASISTTDGAELDALMTKYGCTEIQPVFRRNLYENGTLQPLEDVGVVHAAYMSVAANNAANFSQRRARHQGSTELPDLSSVYVIRFDASKSVTQAAQEWAQNSNVVYAEPNYLHYVAAFNDPYLSSTGSWGQAYDDLWNIKIVSAPSAWPLSTGAGQVVAVIDSGVDSTHPDLAANMWVNEGETPGDGLDNDDNGFVDDIHGYDFGDNDSSIGDIDFHGTHVAGTIAAVGNNSIGVVGVAPAAKIMAVKLFGEIPGASVDQVAAGVVYAADNGADVANLSVAAPTTSALDEALEYAYRQGLVIVAAAGNFSDDALGIAPANHRRVLTVSASTYDDQLAYYSNLGSKIDIAAPGGGTATPSSTIDLLSTLNTQISLQEIPSPYDAGVVGTNYIRSIGTSMAAPMVAGAAAVIGALNPHFTQEQIRHALRISAADLGAPGFDLRFGHGRLNLQDAVLLQSVPVARIDLDPVAGFGTESSSVPVTISAGGSRSIVGWQLSYSALDGTNSIVLAQGSSVSSSEFSVPVNLAQVPFGDFLLTLKAEQNDGLVARDDRRLSNSIYSEGSSAQLPPTSGGWSVFAKAGDVNGDGIDDVLMGDPLLAGLEILASSTTLWLGQPGGGFKDVSDDALPPDHNSFGRPYEAEFADLDQDGDLDIVICAQGIVFGAADHLRVWINDDGTGVFVDRSAQLLPSSLPPHGPAGYGGYVQVEIGDIDADGAMDIVTTANGLRILRATGSGFVDVSVPTHLPLGPEKVLDIRLVDMDRVNGPDVVASLVDAGARVALNDGTGSFSVAQNFGNSFKNDTLAVGDVTGDAFPDVVGYDVFSKKPEVFVNQGNGLMVHKVNAFSNGEYDTPFRLEDVDLDGTQDLITSVAPVIYTGSGDGSFSTSGPPLLPSRSQNTSQIVPLEATGDGFIDLLSLSFLATHNVLRGRWPDLAFGDVTDDDRISGSDIQSVVNHLSNSGPLTGQALFRARVALGKPSISKLDVYTLHDRLQNRVEELPVLFGDANRDGRVTDADAQATLAAASAPTYLDLDGRYRADANLSGTITASDALLVSRYVNGTLSRLPQSRPVLDPVSNRIGTSGVPISFALRVVDHDGDQVAISADGLPAGSQLITTHRAIDDIAVFSWIPPVIPNGSVQYFPLLFRASDGETVTKRSMTIQVGGNGACTGAPNGTSCDDFVYCNGSDSCSNGDCTVHAGSPCAAGICPQTCDEALDLCMHTVGNPCNDGVNCTTEDMCFGGICAGALLDCASLDTNCAVGTCRESDGACIADPYPSGTACDDDSNLCTIGDTCLNSICSGGTPKDCSALTPPTNCAIGTCQPRNGKCGLANNPGIPCDDGFFCNGENTCFEFACQEPTGDPCESLYEGSEMCSSFECNESTNSCELRAAGEFCFPDDDDCTVDECDGEGGCYLPLCPTCPLVQLPDAICEDLTNSRLSYRKNDEAPGKNRFSFSSARGDAVSRGDLGDPLLDTGYSLCVYANQDLIWESVVEAQQTCQSGATTCWTANDTQVQFREPTKGPLLGLRQMQLKARESGLKSRISGEGAYLAIPADLASLASSDVVFQMFRTSGVAADTKCWEAVFERPNRSDARSYRASTAD